MNYERSYSCSFDLILKPLYCRIPPTPGTSKHYTKLIWREGEDNHYLHCEIYANGQNESEKGYVSIIFKKKFDENSGPIYFSLPKRFTLKCTVSLKDKNGTLRIPQSFAFFTEFEGKSLNSTITETFSLEKFISREYLSNNIDDFLTARGLFFHCDVDVQNEYYTDDSASFTPVDTILSHVELLGRQKLKIPFHSPEFQVLSNYEYFQVVQNIPMKEAEQKYIEIDRSEIPAFWSMINYIKTKNMDQIYTLKQLLELYVITNKYQIIDVFNICGDELKKCLAPNNAFMVLKFCTDCGDKILEELVIEYVHRHPETLLYKFQNCDKENDDNFDIDDSMFCRMVSEFPDDSNDNINLSNYVLVRHLHQNEKTLDYFE